MFMVVPSPSIWQVTCLGVGQGPSGPLSGKLSYLRKAATSSASVAGAMWYGTESETRSAMPA